MKITVHNGEMCELLPNGDKKRLSDDKIVYTKPKEFSSINIKKGGRIG